MEQVSKRIGDVERDRAVELLREHHAAGRIDLDEFDERMTAALAAKTQTDVAALFVDLPGASPLTVPPRTMITRAPILAWSVGDEQQLTMARDHANRLRLLLWTTMPAVVGLNMLTHFQFWFVFPMMAILLGPTSITMAKRVTQLEEQRTRALTQAA